MKINFMCKLVIKDEFNNIAMEDVDVLSVNEIAKRLIEEIEQDLTPRGKVTIEEPYLNIER